jgi:hypothetical protein
MTQYRSHVTKLFFPYIELLINASFNTRFYY